MHEVPIQSLPREHAEKRHSDRARWDVRHWIHAVGHSENSTPEVEGSSLCKFFVSDPRAAKIIRFCHDPPLHLQRDRRNCGQGTPERVAGDLESRPSPAAYADEAGLQAWLQALVFLQKAMMYVAVVAGVPLHRILPGLQVCCPCSDLCGPPEAHDALALRAADEGLCGRPGTNPHRGDAWNALGSAGPRAEALVAAIRRASKICEPDGALLVVTGRRRRANHENDDHGPKHKQKTAGER
mmetsp:Transcript_78819/g.219098  ORF Transcript_78819/g.219098 Transcript_78819/m.219098 type:complete len:240 (+) Transcript_78819:280-999(+)